MNELDCFGKIIMEEVRDTAIYEWSYLISGKSKSPSGKKMNELLKPFSEELRKILIEIEIVPMIVDSTIAYFLTMLENHEEILLGVQHNGNHIKRLQDEYSDDTSLEVMYGAEGWIRRYSSEKSKYLDD